MSPPIPGAIVEWFARRGWEPFDYQLRAWRAYLAGRSGLIHAPTGVGKSLAAWLGPVIEELVRPPAKDGSRVPGSAAVLWITPMRALASDTLASLAEPLAELGLPWTIEKRTSDTAASVKKRQRQRLPTALVTTPESLSLLLSYPETRQALSSLRCVVVDEWHELLGTKRGTQTELALARLRGMAGESGRTLRIWGLSATLGNLEEAARALLGVSGPQPCLIRGVLPKEVVIDTARPVGEDGIERFPWSGHMGLAVLPEVVAAIEQAWGGGGTTLLFTNTRAQAEIWFKRLLQARPDWLGEGGIAIHHGSLDHDLRGRVEDLLKRGRLRCVVCTSSLDLGVDFSPVDQVIQVGSPKGVARLVQRAGRSGHRPGAASRILGVPTHAMELVEFAAVRGALARGELEARVPLDRPLDVLVQHLVTVAAGAGDAGLDEQELRAEVRTTAAFAGLSDAEWNWAMDFVRGGGAGGGGALRAYPRFARLVPAGSPERRRYRVASADVARLHRLAIGTITGESSMIVRYVSGRALGTIEESFIGRLRPGDRFVFAGRLVELDRVHDMTALVRRTNRRSGIVPRWNGGRFPLSTQLAAAVRDELDQARRGIFAGPEMLAARPLLELQRAWSIIPAPGQLLVEQIRTEGADGGYHEFIYPFDGRSVQEGLAALLAFRLTRPPHRPRSVIGSATDYGLELFSDGPLGAGAGATDLDEPAWRALLSTENLLDDLLACLNSTQLARRQFRDIARIAGLLVPSYPGTRKPMRHVQASSDMFFDVFEQFDPANLLLDQARREVLENQLEFRRLRDTLERAAKMKLIIIRPGCLTPFAFPIWAEHLRSTHVSSEKWADRVAKMVLRLEERADGTAGAIASERSGSLAVRKRTHRARAMAH